MILKGVKKGDNFASILFITIIQFSVELNIKKLKESEIIYFSFNCNKITSKKVDILFVTSLTIF